MVRQRQHQIHIPSRIVAYQSFLYLLALYLALLPYFSTEIVFLLRGRFDKTQLLYILRIVQSLQFSLFGVWTLFAYCYFSFERKSKDKPKTNKLPTIPIQQHNQQQQQQQHQINDKNPHEQPISDDDPSITSNSTSINNGNNNSQNEQPKDEMKKYAKSMKSIFSSNEIEMASSPSTSTSSSAAAAAAAATTIANTNNKNNEDEERSRNNTISLRNVTLNPNPRQSSARYSFNIFDGTNATGTFAEFVHDGDSDDEQTDNEMTDHWAAVQDYI